MTGDVDQCEASPLFRMRLEIRLNKDFDGFLAGVYLDAHGRIAKINFMPATVLSSNDGMRHWHLARRQRALRSHLAREPLNPSDDVHFFACLYRKLDPNVPVM
jgi:hypothetical protein